MLDVRRLTIGFGPHLAVRSADLRIDRGDCMGLVGESGCGKSITALSLLGMAPLGSRVTGSITVMGEEMIDADERRWCRRRARDVAMIFQDPMNALNPLKKVGDIIGEPLRVHLGLSRRAARDRTRDLLDEVGFPNPDVRLNQYPHQLSGGQRQRVMIAAAVSCDPELLIADEPTTALDATTAARILDFLARLAKRRRMALLFISHDLEAVARLTSKLSVMYGGDIVERGMTKHVLVQPGHPYTRALLAARPTLAAARITRFATIPGTVPTLRDMPHGCRFVGRCQTQIEICARTRPQMTATAATAAVACWNPHPTADQPTPHPLGRPPMTSMLCRRPSPMATAHPLGRPPMTDHPILSLQSVTRRYRLPRRGWLASAPLLTAVDGVSLSITPGETLGVVGDSGSGKSTLARIAMGLERPDGGRVGVLGVSIYEAPRQQVAQLRPALQMVFQNPYGSLDPRRSVGWSVAEPLLQNKALSASQRRERARTALAQVGLNASDASEFPHQFSGGQLQRIAIARAIITRPRLLVADEPVSSLDVSIQGQILNLLMDLRDEIGLSILMISHDMAVVAHFCNRVAVLRQGKLTAYGTEPETGSEAISIGLT